MISDSLEEKSINFATFESYISIPRECSYADIRSLNYVSSSCVHQNRNSGVLGTLASETPEAGAMYVLTLMFYHIFLFLSCYYITNSLG